MKILIADDDIQILRAVRITLSARGYDVVTASDGRAAIDAAASTHPDLLVVDLGMPGLTGIEVIEAVRGLDADADSRRLGPQRVLGQGRGAGRRRGRLRHEAVLGR